MYTKKMRKVFLAGAHADQFKKYIKAWRRRLVLELDMYEIIDPYIADNSYDSEVGVSWDLLAGADIVIAEMGIRGYSYIGTGMEILYAKQNNIPVYVFPDLFKDHAYVQYCALEMFGDLNECIDYMQKLSHFGC